MSLAGFLYVGETGFEPATPWSQTRCATTAPLPELQLIHSIKNCKSSQSQYRKIISKIWDGILFQGKYLV